MVKKTFTPNLFLITALAISLLLSSCSNSYVSTNFDKENFSDYFSASAVKIYKNEQEFHGRYQFIGAVEGQDCQEKAHHVMPDKINARTQARQQAFTLNANAVVFSGCALLDQEQLAQINSQNSRISKDAQQCQALVICYAKAYAIEVAK